MSLSSPSTSSLYQTAQKFKPTPLTLSVSFVTLQTVVSSFLTFLKEQRIQGILWAKLPVGEQWLKQIEQYQEQGFSQQIYWCHTRKNPPKFATSHHRRSPRSSITPIVLEASSQLKKEFFLFLVSPQICSAIIAQEQSPNNSEIENKNSIQHLNLIYSFEPALVKYILEKIKQSITITDTTPAELLMESDLSFQLPDSLPSSLLSQLLCQQIQKADQIHTDSLIVKQAQKALENLTQLVHFKDQLLKNLSQELSLPLTNMKTALKLLESMQSKRELRQRYIDLLQRECLRQNILLAGLQEFVQLDQNTSSQVNPKLKLEDLIPGIVSTYQPLAEEKGILLGYTVPAGLPPVDCPEAWLRQIILNLLSNSLKFTPPNGRVFVEAKLKNEVIEVKVSDTGVGIDKSDLPHIFESFYRGKNTIDNDTQGAGLGLTVVQQLLQRCQASLKIDSHSGKGSIFTLTFAVYEAES